MVGGTATGGHTGSETASELKHFTCIHEDPYGPLPHRRG